MRSQHQAIPVLMPTKADELKAIGWFFQGAYVYHPDAINNLAAIVALWKERPRA